MSDFVRGSVIVGVLLCWSPPVFGQDNAGRRFHPVPSPDGLLGLHSSKGLGQQHLFVGYTLDYANDEFVFRSGNQVTDRPVAHRVVGELGLAFGLWDWLDLGLSFPVVAGRWARGRLLAGQRRYAFGPGDLRLLAKGVILKNRQWAGWGLSVVIETSVPSGPKRQFLSNSHPAFLPRIVADYRFAAGGVISLNLAYLFQRLSWMGDLPLDDEVQLGLGAELPLPVRSLSVLASVEGAVGLGAALQDRHFVSGLAPLEGRMGFRWRSRLGLEATLGAALGLTSGYGTPDVRVLLSVGMSRPLGSRAPQAGAVVGELRRIHGISGIEGRRMGGTWAAGRRPHRSLPGGVFGDTRFPSRPAARDVSARQPSVALLREAAARDPDPDGDGLVGALDRCPTKPEDRDGFEDGDGCPDPDNDRDGIPDIHDKCPDRPETVNGVRDEDGCPDKGQAKVVVSSRRIRILQKIMFTPGSDRIRSESFALLRQVAALLKKSWWIRRVLIEGHTDDRGDEEQNVDLSIRRAYRVRAFLVKEGVAPERLMAKGFGSARPIADNRTKQGMAKNRRVVFVILDAKGGVSGKGALR